MVTKAVIPCAGFGTRFLPATKACAKEMFPILDIPALQLIVEEAVESGIKDILIILGKNKKQIEDHFDISIELENTLYKAGKFDLIKKMREISSMANFHYVRQPEMNGSAGALSLAKTFAGGDPVAVMFGDDVIYSPDKAVLKQLIDAYDQTGGASIIGCQRIKCIEEACKYGLVIPGKTDGRFTEMLGFKEKPKPAEAPSNLANLGRFVFNNEIFDYIEDTPAVKNGEKYITDTVALMIEDKKKVFAYEFDGRRYDTGDKFGFVEATIEYALRNNEISEKLKSYIKDLAKRI